MSRRRAPFVLSSIAAVALAAGLAVPQSTDAAQAFADVLSFDHYVDSVSQSPTFKGTPIKLFVRERIQDKVLKAGRNSTNGKVVLFVHGGTYPSVPDFDLPYQDYSWMAYLAAQGFDVYSVDMTGYGKSSRPNMDDKCNIVADQQAIIGQAPCPAKFANVATSTESDWADVDAAVEFVRKQTGAAKINLIGWSGGGPRVGGYTAQHPEKVARVVFLAPGYSRETPDKPAAKPAQMAPTAITTREMAMARWDKAIKCDNQYDPAIRDAIWQSNLDMDPMAAKWGPGVVRKPTTVGGYGWNAKLSPKFNVPVLMLVGNLDNEVLPERVRNLYDDISSESKILINLECGSHYVVYENVYKVLHEASKDWLLTGKYNGATRAVFNADRKGKLTPAE